MRKVHGDRGVLMRPLTGVTLGGRTAAITDAEGARRSGCVNAAVDRGDARWPLAAQDAYVWAAPRPYGAGVGRRAPLARKTHAPPVGGVGRVLPAVRIAPAHELAAAVVAAPLLRDAQRLARWVGADRLLTARGLLRPADAVAVIADLEITGDSQSDPPTTRRPRSAGDIRELDLLWRAAEGAGLVVVAGRLASGRPGVLRGGDAERLLVAWKGALDAVFSCGPQDVREELEGLAIVLYAAGAPVRMDALAEAFAIAAHDRWRKARGGRLDTGGRMSRALEVLADLGVAELGVDEEDDQLTVALTDLGAAGMRDRLIAAGFSAPVAGSAAESGAAGLLAGLAGCDAEDGENEIAAWLAQRTPQQAAAELLSAASKSSPGARGAAFAIIDRLGERVVPLVRSAMADPVLRPHAAIWLREQGLPADLSPGEKAWLLVDLGAGLLEDAEPGAVAAELLPDLPAAEQAELVGGLWRVSHPGLIGLLTTLTDHHPDARVAKAARKAAFKARSQYLGTG
jgi:hypothetical protein